MCGGEQRIRRGWKQSLMSGVDVIGNGGASVRGKNCIPSFVLLCYQFEFHVFFVVFFILFSFHLGEAAQFVMVLKGK